MIPEQHLPHARIGAERRERPYERGAHELGLFLLEGRNERVRHARVGRVLEEAVRDGPEAIVRARERSPHHVACSRIVEAGEQHEGPIPNVAVRMLVHRLQQRGNSLGGGCAPDRAGGAGPDGVIEIAQLVDRCLQLGGRRRLRRGRFLRKGVGPDMESSEDTENTQETAGTMERRLPSAVVPRRATVSHRYIVTGVTGRPVPCRA
jgi:hypothetical protein